MNKKTCPECKWLYPQHEEWREIGRNWLLNWLKRRWYYILLATLVLTGCDSTQTARRDYGPSHVEHGPIGIVTTSEPRMMTLAPADQEVIDRDKESK